MASRAQETTGKGLDEAGEIRSCWRTREGSRESDSLGKALPRRKGSA